MWTPRSRPPRSSTDRPSAGSTSTSRARAGRRPPRCGIFVTGAGQWRDLPAWPPATTPQVHRLRADGRLAPTPDTEADAGTGKAAVVGFRYDPADPTPSVGGRTMARDAGVRDNTALEARPDVLSFTSPPLSADLEVIGAPTVEIVLSTDNPHTDLFVRFCEVDRRGVSHNISDVFQRLDPNRPTDGPTTVRLTLTPCAHRVPAGHALRLQLSGGSHPRYARNLGTDAPPGAGSTVVPSHYSVHCTGSSLTLPIDPSQGLPR
ncbi:CocE/NonD family hydrolase [Streptacidiphilus sp. PAMC 29251]